MGGWVFLEWQPRLFLYGWVTVYGSVNRMFAIRIPTVHVLAKKSAIPCNDIIVCYATYSHELNELILDRNLLPPPLGSWTENLLIVRDRS